MTTRSLLYRLSELLHREADAARRAGLTLEERGELEAYAAEAERLELELEGLTEEVDQLKAELETAKDQALVYGTAADDAEKKAAEMEDRIGDLELALEDEKRAAAEAEEERAAAEARLAKFRELLAS